MNKKAILIVFIVLVSAVGIYQGFLKKEKPAFNLVEVTRGNIIQEVSETGQVQKGEKINLGFKNTGRIEKIYISVGEEIKAGDILARLETTELKIQLQEAKANLSLAQAKLNKLLAGASQEEIKISQTKVENSKLNLETVKQSLEDTYEDTLNVLEDSYLKTYNSQNTADVIQRTYFITADQAGIKVRENKEEIESSVSKIKTSLTTAKANPTQENINLTLSQIKTELSDIAGALKIIRETCEEPEYRNIISSTDKSSLDTHRANINTAITNIINSEQSINSAKLAVNSAEGQLQVVKDELALLTAPPLKADIDIYQAELGQVEAQIKFLENQIQEANLKSPITGQIAEIKKRVGEIVQPMLQDVVITILPATPFEIEVDVYEEDIVKVSVGNPVDISLIAFPDEIFEGKVVAIDPAQKLIEGVVYYKATIVFEELPAGLKPGMTADLVIKTASKENVLIIPKGSLQEKNSKKIVQVFKDGEIQDREIKIGLQGNNDMVEVISGLEEGEKIILP